MKGIFIDIARNTRSHLASEIRDLLKIEVFFRQKVFENGILLISELPAVLESGGTGVTANITSYMLFAL